MAALARLTFDDRGHPATKLPDCPVCGEDELFVAAPAIARVVIIECYRCPFELRWPGRRA